MKTIGFAGTFYTLWDVEVERVDVSLGAWYNKVTCTYYKNLSKSLEEAIIKSGISNVDDTLKGKRRSFKYNTQTVLEPKIMDDCEKLFYILFANSPAHSVDGVRQDAFNRCLELGYVTEVKGSYELWLKDERERVIDSIAYKFNHILRYEEDIWYSSTLKKFFIGII